MMRFSNHHILSVPSIYSTRVFHLEAKVRIMLSEERNKFDFFPRVNVDRTQSLVMEADKLHEASSDKN